MRQFLLFVQWRIPPQQVQKPLALSFNFIILCGPRFNKDGGGVQSADRLAAAEKQGLYIIRQNSLGYPENDV